MALEDATKLIQAFLLSGKQYVCLMQLHGDAPESRVRSVIDEFKGDIYQRPPLRASVKREIRKRRIYDIDILEIDQRRALFTVDCQAGTYVRKLCSDMGEVLGFGADMRELRRTRAGPFKEEKSTTIHELLNAFLEMKEHKNERGLREVIRPMEEAVEYLAKIYMRDSAVDAICHGADLAVPGIVKLDQEIRPGTTVAFLSLKGEAIALGRALVSSEHMLREDRGIAAKTTRVIMPPGTYPPMWRKNK
ncbi:MAG: RNA-guided pseudouridylation complex pseudouridine synthase subunit Cbf5 [archaeon]